MASPWPPPRDLDVVGAARTFSEKIHADPLSYGIDAATAAELLAAALAFEAAMEQAVAPSSRTSTAVVAKNTARSALLQIMRRVAARVRAHPGTSDEQLKSLGMVVPDRVKSPVATPAAEASVTVARIERLAHEVRVSERSGTRRALPKGCVGYAVFSVVYERGSKPPTDPRDFRFEGVGTRPTFRITYRAADAGKQATVFVRYLNRKGQLGPASAAATCMVAA